MPLTLAVVSLSARGKVFSQTMAQELAGLDRVILLCGRYEGMDERIAEHLADREVSVGDFVMSGGELGAALIVDCVTRLLISAKISGACALALATPATKPK